MVSEFSYVYKKDVDKSMLKEGISIPVSFQPLLQADSKYYLKRGERREIELIIEGSHYTAVLKNQSFNEENYPGRSDILQIRYTAASGIPKLLQQIFRYSNGYISRAEKPVKKEYLAIYVSDNPNVFYTESIVVEDLSAAERFFYHYPELELETLLEASDESAGIVSEPRIIKIRKLDREIGNSLKIYYKYRCQICGQDIGHQYDVRVAHSHHIAPFSISMNNDSSNIMIVCPNHHSVIHSANPAFDRKSKCFLYGNGFREGLLLNHHI